MSGLTAEAASQIILGTLRPLATEVIPFEEALGRVLGEDLTADVPVPPFPQSAMDGFAVRSVDTADATPACPITLSLLGTLAAGHQAVWELSPGTAVRIMTGASIPPGADAVVKREDTECDAASVRLGRPVPRHDNIVAPGRDISTGATLLRAGDIIPSWGVGVCAALGKTQVSVYRRPQVGILALGDELVPPHLPLGPGQIHVSNLYALVAAVTKYGGLALNLGIAGDQLEAIEAALRRAGEVDLLLTLGGSQRGDFDLVDDLLDGTHGQIIFREVAANYVRSMIFGRFGRLPLCGLPGSPIASFVAFEAFVRDAIWKLAGRRLLAPMRLQATLDGRLPPTGDRDHFQPVWVEVRPEGLLATPLQVQKAPNHPPSTLANGLIRRPPASPACEAGHQVQVEIVETVYRGSQVA
jgi:molybdopterin molybdotransferase